MKYEKPFNFQWAYIRLCFDVLKTCEVHDFIIAKQK